MQLITSAEISVNQNTVVSGASVRPRSRIISDVQATDSRCGDADASADER